MTSWSRSGAFAFIPLQQLRKRICSSLPPCHFSTRKEDLWAQVKHLRCWRWSETQSILPSSPPPHAGCPATLFTALLDSAQFGSVSNNGVSAMGQTCRRDVLRAVGCAAHLADTHALSIQVTRESLKELEANFSMQHWQFLQKSAAHFKQGISKHYQGNLTPFWSTFK